MSRFIFAAAGLVALCGTAAAQHDQPDPNRPYTTVSRLDPWTGSYSNSEFYYNRYTGQPTERGYGWATYPAYSPPVFDPAPYGYAPPPVVYYPRLYGWPPPPRVLAGPRYWRR